VGAVGLEATGNVVSASLMGLIQQLPLGSLRRCQRGGVGQIGVQFQQRGDQLVDLCNGNTPVLGVILKGGRSLRLTVEKQDMNNNEGRGKSLEVGDEGQVCEMVPLLIY